MKTSFAIVTLSAALAACSVAPQQQTAATGRAGAAPAEAQPAADAVLAQADTDARAGRWQQAVDALLGAARDQREARLARRATGIAREAGSLPDTAAAARLWFELEPTVEAADAYARASLAAGDHASAGTAFSQIVGRATDTARGTALRYVLGVVAQHGQDEQFAGLLEQVAQPYPELVEAQVLLAEAARWRGDKAAAREHAGRALAQDPRSPFAALALAQASEGDQGLAVLERFLRAQPDEVDVRHAYGLMLASHERMEDAARELSRVLAAAPDNADLLFTLGLVELRSGDLQAARRHLGRVVELDGDQRNAAAMALANLELDRGDAAAAARWLDQVAPGGEADDLPFLRAAVTAAQGDLAGGRRMLAAISANDDATRIRVVMAEAEMLSDAGQDAEAFAALKDGVRRFPGDEALLYEYALAAEMTGDLGEAERVLRLLVQRNPRSAEMLNALGYTLADHNTNLREARKLITEALRLEPESESIIDSLGWLEYRSGKLKKAESLLRKAWGKRKDAEIGAHLAEVLWKRGKRAEARKLLAEARAADPRSKVVRDTAARLGVKP